MKHFTAYPLKFKPIYKERVWGGSTIERVYHKGFPLDKPIGESWELCDHLDDISEVINGPYAGRNLNNLMLEYKEAILGEDHLQVERFPVLVKILDPNEKLSIQVHPDEEYVESHPDVEAPKAEVWYIAEAAPGAQIIRGVKGGVEKEELRRRIADGTLEEVMNFVPVIRGCTYPILAGTIHALLPGSLVFEIQQNSDTTFRLYDWGRVGLDGKPRELHIEHGLACTHIVHQEFEIQPIAPNSRVIFRSPTFEVIQHDLVEQSRTYKTKGYQVVTVVDGACGICIEGSEFEPVVMKEGDTALVPALSGSYIIHCNGKARFLVTQPI